MKHKAVYLVFAAILLAACSDGPVSNTGLDIHVDANGSVFLGAQQAQPVENLTSLVAELGPPSRTKTVSPWTNQVWDRLGLMTVHGPDGVLVRINLKLRGALPDRDANPSHRFTGSLVTPRGAVQFDPTYVETDGLGFQPYMGDRNAIVQTIGGTEVMIGGPALQVGRPDLVSITLNR